MPRRPRLVRGKDYEIVEGQLQFSREYLIGLGACCQQDCRNCPYDYEKQQRDAAKPQQPSPTKVVSAHA